MEGQTKIFRHHLRRSSLDTLIKIKKDSSIQNSSSFRKSFSSFDKIKSTQNQSLPQIKLDNPNSNIYFNPHSRANFFKNLIDSYFVKNEQNFSKQKKQEGKNFSNRSYLLRKSLMNHKLQNSGILLKQKQNAQKKIQIKNWQQNQSSNSFQQNKLKDPKEKERRKVSYRYKQQNKSPKLIDKNELLTSNTQNSSKQQTLKVTQNNNNEASFLPKITQAVDDFDQNHHDQFQTNLEFIQTTDTFMRGTSSFSLLQKRGQKSTVFENSIVKIYKTGQSQQKKKIKQFKNFIFIERHNKAVSLGIKPIWNEYRFDELSLSTDTLYSLKDNLYKIYANPAYQDNFIIQPKQLYFKLVANQCQQLFMMFCQIVTQLTKLHRKVINNSITPSNLYLMKDGKIKIGDWQYSAFKNQNQIQGGYFQSRIQPILKCENQWLVQPEYLAPQILQSAINEGEHFDLWKCDNISDVYSLGLTFLQIITLIPMNTNKQTSIKSKPILRPREGLLNTSNKSIQKILSSQKNLIQRMSLVLQRQLDKNETNPKFFSILLKMIEPNRQKRISFNEILQEIQ